MTQKELERRRKLIAQSAKSFQVSRRIKKAQEALQLARKDKKIFSNDQLDEFRETVIKQKLLFL